MSESAIRKERLAAYMRRHNLKPTPWSIQLGFSRTYLRMLLAEDREFGERAARKIEGLAGMPYKYLDTPEADPQDGGNLEALEPTTVPHLTYFANAGWRRHTSRASMLPAQLLASAGGQAENIGVWISTDGGMAPTIPEGAECVVDTSNKPIVAGKIYLLALRHHPVIRRVNLTADGYRLVGGEHTEPLELSDEQWRQLVVVGGRIRYVTLEL